MKNLRAFVALVLVCAFAAPSHAAVAQNARSGYDTVSVEGERLYAEGAFARALEAYLRVDVSKLSPDQARWVRFRRADALWRAYRTADTKESATKIAEATSELESLPTPDVQDLVWAEAHESLGDLLWRRPESYGWGPAWQHYVQALDWWAGRPDTDQARGRYLRIVRAAAEPYAGRPDEVYGSQGQHMSRTIVENALKISRTDEERAFAHYLLAISLSDERGYEESVRTPVEFEAALAPGKSAPWYDDALFAYAKWLADTGPAKFDDENDVVHVPDYDRALALFERISTEFKKGESRYYDLARDEIAEITEPSVSVTVSDTFLPGSRVVASFNWRNADRVSYALYPIDLPRDVRMSAEGEKRNWIDAVALAGRAAALSGEVPAPARQAHVLYGAEVSIAKALPVGAYVLEARGGALASRDLVLVTDAALVLKTSPTNAIAYVCDARSGAPVASARVALWATGGGAADDRNTIGEVEAPYARRFDATTNASGFAELDLTGLPASADLFASAALGARQAFVDEPSRDAFAPDAGWRVYAYTDRPAYRPGETARWKFTARTYRYSTYATPAGQRIEYEIADPRNAVVAKGTSTLNAFGSAWGSLDLSAEMPLGEYTITFWTEKRAAEVGSATLFRLEEYKLPEFYVAVRTPEENGRRKTFRPGDRVEVDVRAEYFSGGPVVGAAVEVLVYRESFSRRSPKTREDNWLFEPPVVPSNEGSGGAVAERGTVVTDASGRATFRFDATRYGKSDYEYRIEARVTDASRREVRSDDAIRVTRQRYFVDADASGRVRRPGERADVVFTALDANDQPVAVEGTVRVTRDRWVERWRDSLGRDVPAAEVARLRARGQLPPAPGPGMVDWTLASEGYEHEEVLTRQVRTGADGRGELAFEPAAEGFYRVAWASKDDAGTPIQAETTIWVASDATRDIGYDADGAVEISSTAKRRARVRRFPS